MSSPWKGNFTPDSTSSELLQAWLQEAELSLVDASPGEVRQFLTDLRRRLDLDMVDLPALREYAVFCANVVSNPRQERLIRDFEATVRGLILDFGPTM